MPEANGTASMNEPNFAAKLLAWLKRAARIASRLGWNVARSYWLRRHGFAEFLWGFAPTFRKESLLRREVHLLAHEPPAGSRYDSHGWMVQLPACCVVCAEPTSGVPAREERDVDDPRLSLAAILACLWAGLVWTIIRWSAWPLLVFGLLGLLLGALLKRPVRLTLFTHRCGKHADRVDLPQAYLRGQVLVLRFGDRRVRQIFMYGKPMDSPRDEASGWQM
jgi:hypothetical protein